MRERERDQTFPRPHSLLPSYRWKGSPAEEEKRGPLVWPYSTQLLAEGPYRPAGPWGFQSHSAFARELRDWMSRKFSLSLSDEWTVGRLLGTSSKSDRERKAFLRETREGVSCFFTHRERERGAERPNRRGF